MTDRDKLFKEAVENYITRYPETIGMLAEMERLEREERLSEQEAARALRARPRTA